jgi:outer membrane biosynthesis protein TonB
MYFDFEDYRPDISPVGSAISWREGVLLSIIFHLVVVVVVLAFPRLFAANPARARSLALQQQEQPRFVFIEPREDFKARKPPERAELSDQDRQARAPKPEKKPENPMPFSRGNTQERVERAEDQAARGRGPQPDPSVGQQARAEPLPDVAPKLPDTSSAMQFSSNRTPDTGGSLGESLGAALKHFQRDVQNGQFNNPQGDGGGLSSDGIQFDSKGVEFGPWIRRFIAQVKRNWQVPYAAMMSKGGHVVITFNVYKSDGRITDLNVIGPSPVDAFNNAAYGALVASNPTVPLPPEYPADKAFFTVTFYYNEEPRSR